MCIASATANVRITVGAAIDIGVSSIPAYPPIPIPTIVDKMIKIKTAIVGLQALIISPTIMNIIRNIIGVIVPASFIPASANALFRAATPET